MEFTDPIPFREAVRILAAKKLMPTNLTSAELAQLNKEILRTSFTSAQTTIEGLLDRYKSGIENIINPTMEPGADFNPAKLRAFIKDYLKSISYEAPEGKEGTIQDLSSDRRINLMVKTNTEMVQGAGTYIQGNSNEDVVDLYPAWEFKRVEARDKERDWEGANGLWVNACRRAEDDRAIEIYGETGRMIALKSSDVWDEISDPDYTPGGLDNPYDPVAFGTGMWRFDVARKVCEEVGLIEPGEEVEPADFDVTELFKN